LSFRCRDEVELLPGHGFDDALDDLAAALVAVADDATSVK